ncbi:hypothetical protein BU23DRAFT_538992 [Bimuria novae-zelandiae CBS 107.79]|uniref:Heterokaryon incompatibility domain-containing protein n=1 Tax=Bimuria novae-zelandiae CBS 107.79 TaxID=1447943 RepID=A0A6A5UZ73_9PLEO|nr:hypothetical protein BU23DRAFT_538992 [Bimuria novae-zelandiae CBS 107.79]
MALLEALRRLMNPPWTPWWKQIWVVQEITMPKNVLMMRGSVSAPWSMFAEATSSLLKHSGACCASTADALPRDLWRVLLDFSSQVHDIQGLRSAYRHQTALISSTLNQELSAKQPQETSLLKLLQRFRNRRASDARDKVYALLALAKTDCSRRSSDIAPDYSLSEKEVYTKVTLAIIHDTGSLTILSTDTGRKFRQDLPSWVPDWDAPGAQSHEIRAESIHHYEVMCMRPYTGSRAISLPRMDGFRLRVQAARRADVAQVEEVMWGHSTSVSRETIKKWCDAVTLAQESLRFPITRFWELLCAEIICRPSASSSNVGIRRTTPKDEIVFIIWAIESLRSPLRMQLVALLPAILSMKPGSWKHWESWLSSTDSDGYGYRRLKKIIMQRDGLPDEVVSDHILERTFPLRGRRRAVFEEIAQEYGVSFPPGEPARDRQEDTPWDQFFRGITEFLNMGDKGLDARAKTRRERVAAMDSSIMAAMLSRRLFFTKDGDVGLA